MASLSAGSGHIDRGYYEPTLQRSQFNTGSFNANGHSATPVSISHAELLRLQSIAQKYENLRKNLLRGGVGEDVIDLLSQNDAEIEGADNPSSTVAPPAHEDGGTRLTEPSPQSSLARQQSQRSSEANGDNNRFGGFGAQVHGNRGYEHPAWTDDGHDPDDVSCDGESPLGGASNGEQQKGRPYYERQCVRTIQLMNLADGTTHRDITSAVRGGLLLDVFMRTHERSATVSFLNAADAKSFFDHARKHDLYIKNKRVDIKWSDRQFILPGHVAAKIGNGATRNLVIRQFDPKQHSEESIRDDLEHIHNLVVVKIDIVPGSCYIKTNSVHNALFAKMCMMSRAKYKNSKIEWDADECAQPYEKVQQFKPRKEAPPAKRNPKSTANRFHLLNLDDDDGEDEIVPTFQSKNSVGIAA